MGEPSRAAKLALLALALALPVFGIVTGRWSIVWLLSAPGFILLPGMLFPKGIPPRRADGGGGGGGPQAPQLPPAPPSGGGIPLDDAQQSRVRMRDHVRPRWARPRLRTSSDEPRAPQRAPR